MSRKEGNPKHGLVYEPIYTAYHNMKQRCTNKNNPQYKDYGGRGIKVCDRWLSSFELFVADMGTRPKGMTLDRIDVNGDYEPSNCRWADRYTQMANRQKNSSLGLGVRPVTGGYMVRCGHDYMGYTRDLEEAKRMYLDAVNKKRQTNDQL